MSAAMPLPPWEELEFNIPKEGRSTHRFLIRRAAYLEAGSRRWTAVVEDVTHDGLGLVSPLAPPPPGTLVTVTVLVDGATIELPGEVAWFWSEGERWRLGIHLDTRSAAPGARKGFQRWLARLELTAAAVADL